MTNFLTDEESPRAPVSFLSSLFLQVTDCITVIFVSLLPGRAIVTEQKPLNTLRTESFSLFIYL